MMGLGRYRNKECPCGSKKKFKYCHMEKHQTQQGQLATPIQKMEKEKQARYYNKKYAEMAGGGG